VPEPTCQSERKSRVSANSPGCLATSSMLTCHPLRVRLP
jgi:N-acetyl-gamma-glutamylphosphate reductase